MTINRPTADALARAVRKATSLDKERLDKHLASLTVPPGAAGRHVSAYDRWLRDRSKP
jgi:hypothetical protein